MPLKSGISLKLLTKKDKPSDVCGVAIMFKAHFSRSFSKVIILACS